MRLKFDSYILDGYRVSSFSVAGLGSCGYQSDWKEEGFRLRKTIGEDCGRPVALLAQFPRYNPIKHHYIKIIKNVLS